MDTIDHRRDNGDGRASAASCEKIILYVDDFASGQSDLSPDLSYNRARNIQPDVPRTDYRVSSLYPSASPAYPGGNLGQFHLDDRSALYPPYSAERSASPNTLGSQASTPRRSRCNLDVDQRSSRRSSIQSSRSRANSCSRPTPLGRRRSVSSMRRQSASPREYMIRERATKTDLPPTVSLTRLTSSRDLADLSRIYNE